MKTIKTNEFVKAIVIFASCGFGAGTSGGIFEIKDAVVGGSSASASASASDGDFEIDAIVGQPAAGGPLRGGPFGVTSGFWTFTPLAPTAARVSISGRVTTSNGRGISNVVILLQTQEGELYAARSSFFGYYMFEEIEAGQSVFITVRHKRYTFEPRLVMVSDSISGLDFIAQP